MNGRKGVNHFSCNRDLHTGLLNSCSNVKYTGLTSIPSLRFLKDQFLPLVQPLQVHPCCVCVCVSVSVCVCELVSLKLKHFVSSIMNIVNILILMLDNY